MRLPTYSDLIPEQRAVSNVPLDQDLFVAGPPGSGKTVLAIRRTKGIADLVGRGGVVLLTFNRMLRRLVELLFREETQAQAGLPPISQLNTTTMHSLVGDDYKRRTGDLPPYFGNDEYDYRWAEMTTRLAGHVGEHCFQHLVIDEGQDLPPEFYAYARQFIAPRLSVFADELQAITARRSTLTQIRDEAGLSNPLLLTVNHRNTTPIARFAEHFHTGRLPHASVRNNNPNARRVVYRRFSLAHTAQLIKRWFEAQGGTVGVIVKSNNTAAAMLRHLHDLLPSNPATRLDWYTHQQKNENGINLLSPGITLLNAQSVKGQEFDAVFVLEVDRFLPCNTPRDRRVMYMICTRACRALFLCSEQPLSSNALTALPTNLVDR